MSITTTAPEAPCFKPFTFHSNLSGDRANHKVFVEDVYNITSGMNLMLKIAHRSWIDQDNGTPYLNDNQISEIILMAIGVNNLIESQAGKLIDWQNEYCEKKGN